MASRPGTPTNPYGSVPQPADEHIDRGYGSQANLNSGVTDFAEDRVPESSPLSQSYNHSIARLENYQDIQREASLLHGQEGGLDRSASTASTAVQRDASGAAPSRSNTLKKKGSVNRKTSLARKGSRKSLNAGSVKGVGFTQDENYNNALYTPIPTQGSPTDVLADRFQAWRQLLKQLITYFREVQTSYEHRSKALMKVSNVIGNIQHPSVFVTDGGLAEATRILNDYHKHSLTEANKSRDIEQDVIAALSGLRSDLGQKIKEIKSLSGDFKNTVEKEKEGTRKAIAAYQESLQHVNHDAGDEKGRNDPFIVRLGVERMVEKQIDEENYLHRAYLNLETSGRELESIVVGEIQKAYNALASILRREGDDAYGTVESLRTGPIAMPKDQEWYQFVNHDPHFVNPDMPLRRIEDITYPGRDDPSASEIRAGMLERKSKYLKSYTPGWYVLSPTHLHEFKSADKIFSQPPVMSLYLPDQKLGSQSSPDSSSHKFMLKGRQTGGMHRGHSWVFRAESYETMMAWIEAIRNLTEKTGEERNAFVRQHARSVSGNTHRQRALSVSSDGMEEDEADQVPYSAHASALDQPIEEPRQQRPAPGGRFPSDLQVPRTAPLSPSVGSSEPDHDTIAAANSLPGTGLPFPGKSQEEPTPLSKYDTNPYELRGIDAGEDAAIGAGAGALAGGALARREHEREVERSQEQAPELASDAKPVETYQPTGKRRISQPMPYAEPARFNEQQPQTPLEHPRTPPIPPTNKYQEQPHRYQAESAPQQQQQQQPPYQRIADPAPTQTYALPVQQQPTMSQVQQPQPTPVLRPAQQPQQQPASAEPQREPAFEQPQQSQPQTQAQHMPIPRNVQSPERRNSMYGDWLAPVAAGGAGAAAGAVGTEAYHRHQEAEEYRREQEPSYDGQQELSQDPAPIANDSAPVPRRTEPAIDNGLDIRGATYDPSPAVNPSPVPEYERTGPVSPISQQQTSSPIPGSDIPTPAAAYPSPVAERSRDLDFGRDAALGLGVGAAGGLGAYEVDKRLNQPPADRDQMPAGNATINNSAFDANRQPESSYEQPQPSYANRQFESSYKEPLTSALPSQTSAPNTSANGSSNEGGLWAGGAGLKSISSRLGGLDNGLGGLEKEGARETGHIFPSVVRHDTNMSVSRLHVPGEFPKPATGYQG